ncbi:shikimate dehydrogenase [Panacagrimonas sp.]|uniref:shikimate dehydrogenase n=1 Tax=Panacagrimonas sp. TaxID=2480088 RepID=UPI003B52579A
MDRYAVIGQPIAHSKSPSIHAHFARQTGQVLEYTALAVPADRLAEELQRLHALGLRGLNVTLPHKQAVAAQCESISERARQAGAVNTLQRTESGWSGDNTDGVGFAADLKRLGIALRARRVLVLGAGGAARGILEPILAASPALVAVSNRNPWKPEALAESFKPLGEVLPRTHVALKGDRFDVIVNATSAGHSGQMPLMPSGLLAPGGDCYDLSYGPAHAPFAAWAVRQNAARIEDGLGMLVGQAASAFEIWRGVEPAWEAVIVALRRELQVGTDTDLVAAVHAPVHRSHVELPPQD